MKRVKIITVMSFFILSFSFQGEFSGTGAAMAIGNIIPTGLLCEYETNPLGLDVPHPRFYWVLHSEKRGEVQSAYEILVASDEKNIKADIGDMWESGKVDSDQSVHIVYAGKELQSGQKYFWKVRVWDKDGEVSHYSQLQTFEMGFLKPGDWKAQWIAKQPEQKWKEAWSERRAQEKAEKHAYSGAETWDDYKFYKNPVDPAPLLRKEFTIDKPVKDARVYVTGLGYYELSINGVKVGDHVLDPGFTDYDQQVLYLTYDVTSYLKSGENAVGVILGRGWYNMITPSAFGMNLAPWFAQPKMILSMNIQFKDGTDLTIASDETWKAADSPIIWDCVRSGERSA